MKEQYSYHFPFPLFPTLVTLFSPFSKHCKEVYGLNKGEIEYVWDEYKKIIKEKLNNGL